MINLILSDPLLNDTHVPIIYDNLTFNGIQDLMDYDKNFEIEYNLKHNKNILCEDKHPSLNCHKVIAHSIIENIKRDK